MLKMTKHSLGVLSSMLLAMTMAVAVAANTKRSSLSFPDFVCGGGEDKNDTSFTIKLPLVQRNEDDVNWLGWVVDPTLFLNISVHWVEEDETDTMNITSPNGNNTTTLVPNVRPDNDRFVFLSVNFSSGAVDYSNATVQRAFSRLDDGITKSTFFTFDGSSLELYHTYAKAGAYKPISQVCTADAINLHTCVLSCGYENYEAVDTAKDFNSQFCDPSPMYIANDGTCSLQDPSNKPLSPEPSSTGAWLRSPSLFGLLALVVSTLALG